MFRKTLALVMAFIFSFSTIVSVQAAPEMTIVGKLDAVEHALYGDIQTGALLDRIAKLENDLYGKATQVAMVSKVDQLYAASFENAQGQPSLLTQINAAQWAITHSVTSGSIKTRLENLETVIEGSPKSGAYQSRVAALARLAFPDGTVNLLDKTVEADTLVKIKLVTPIDSKTASVGDKITYQVDEDVIVQGVLVFVKGAEGTGTIKKVAQSQNFGRDAKVEVDFNQTTSIDGNVIETFLGEKAKKETETMAIAAGATVAAMALLGPVGIVTGAFVKGKNINIPEGTEMYIQTKAESMIHGVQAEVL